MTPANNGKPNSGNMGTQEHATPPQAERLGPKASREPFSVENASTTIKREVKLTVEFPLRENLAHANDLANYFKKFISVILKADPTMAILNWDHPTQNPIRNASDLGQSEEEIRQYFNGYRVIARAKKVLGYVKIETAVPFRETKGDGKLWKWLVDNKVFLRQTTLSSKRHSNLGWLLYSHPEYTNFVQAVEDLTSRMKTRELEFELLPHNIVHMNSQGIKMNTKALKVRANYDDREKVMRELMEAFKNTDYEALSVMSNTKRFKLIPFTNHLMSVDQVTELLVRQNVFLHQCHAISVINIGDIAYRFQAN